VKYQDLGDIRRGVVKIGGASGNNLKPLVMELAERVKRKKNGFLFMAQALIWTIYRGL